MKKSNQLPPLSDSQLEIMNVIWGRGACTVTDVVEELNAHRPVARNTVLTLMTRLADKGWLIQEKSGRSHLFTASREKQTVQQSMVRRLLQAAFGGNPDGLIMAMVDDGALSAEDLDAIRKRIDDASAGGDRK